MDKGETFSIPGTHGFTVRGTNCERTRSLVVHGQQRVFRLRHISEWHTGYTAQCPDVKDEMENCADPVPDYVFTGYMFFACYDYCDNPDGAYWSYGTPQESCYMDDPEPTIEHVGDQCQVTCNCFCEY